MKRILVAAPLLGAGKHGTISSKHAPLITNPPPPEDGGNEQFILLPSRRYVAVLAYRTGRRIKTILPSLEKEQSVEIVAVALTPPVQRSHSLQSQLTMNTKMATSGNGQILILTCSDGTIRLFDVGSLRSPGNPLCTCGHYSIPGDCYRPYLVLQREGSNQIKRLQVAHATSDAIVVYAMEATAPDERQLVRLVLPTTTDGSSRLVLDNDNEKVLADASSLQQHMPNAVGHAVKPLGLSVCLQPNESDPRAVVLVSYRTLMLFFVEKPSSDPSSVSFFAPLPWNWRNRRRLCIVRMAPNRKDVVGGDQRGALFIFSDVIPSVVQFCQDFDLYQQSSDEKLVKPARKPKHPSSTVVTQRFHWHAHAVTTLAFSPDSAFIYSAGQESAVVTWQLGGDGNTSQRPVHVLPRIARAIIYHLAFSAPSSSDGGGLVVYSADNSLRLLQTHNHQFRWRLQGLGGAGATSRFQAVLPQSPQLRIDPHHHHGHQLVCSGQSLAAAGSIQTYHVQQQQVVSTLEVAPYNRVSRRNPEDVAKPPPTVTHAHLDAQGSTWLTVDVTPTENACVGAREPLTGSDETRQFYGSTTTIRFWAHDAKQRQYQLVSAMASPHGTRHRLSAAALSSDGQHACTVSNDEKAFRLWEKEDTGGKGGISWKCVYRIQFPAGFSKAPCGPEAAAFSPDQSVLSLGFGNQITLWDHESVTLVSSLRHPGKSPVQVLAWVPGGVCENMLLTQSDSHVALHSPYGASESNWIWQPAEGDNRSISKAFLLSKSVAIVVFDPSSSPASQLILLDLEEGHPVHTQFDTHFEDMIVSVVEIPRENDENDEGEDGLDLYVLCRQGDLIRLSLASDEDTKWTAPSSVPQFTAIMPSLKLHLASSGAKRTAPFVSVDELRGDGPKRKKLSVEHFGSFVGMTPVTTTPRLTSKFVRAFVTRNLQKAAHQ